MMRCNDGDIGVRAISPDDLRKIQRENALTLAPRFKS
jgi:hypothetical protein